MVDRDPVTGVQRRVGGAHDFRLFGVADILWLAPGASVLDLGCSRGMVGHELVRAGARLVHGCDKPGAEADTIGVARQVFADIRQVESRFEACDLSLGPKALAVFGNHSYDLVLLFGTYHKIKRQMEQSLLDDLMRFLASITRGHLVWRGGIDKHHEEADEIERAFGQGHARMRRVHWSVLSDMGPAVIWRRG